ncbi:hypothetical protein H4CHR_02122 [Variovorax sp. PBS-H4]|nr:hypothetical protein H4CHR_02122 [Variovorax sp. PBS-H4]
MYIEAKSEVGWDSAADRPSHLLQARRAPVHKPMHGPDDCGSSKRWTVKSAYRTGRCPLRADAASGDGLVPVEMRGDPQKTLACVSQGKCADWSDGVYRSEGMGGLHLECSLRRSSRSALRWRATSAMPIDLEICDVPFAMLPLDIRMYWHCARTQIRRIAGCETSWSRSSAVRRRPVLRCLAFAARTRSQQRPPPISSYSIALPMSSTTFLASPKTIMVLSM